MPLIRKTRRVGNSAGVLLPKSLLGSEVKITVVNKPFDIKKETIKALHNHLDDLQGIYIIGDKPAEILAVSTTTRAIISNTKLKITLVPLNIIKRDLKSNPKLRQRIMKAKAIFNNFLLKKLRTDIKSQNLE